MLFGAMSFQEALNDKKLRREGSGTVIRVYEMGVKSVASVSGRLFKG